MSKNTYLLIYYEVLNLSNAFMTSLILTLES